MWANQALKRYIRNGKFFGDKSVDETTIDIMCVVYRLVLPSSVNSMTEK